VTERCFLKVQFDPAPSGGHVRRAVGGFLRYIQHRDLHPTPKPEKPKPDVAGLVKYVAYRDKASSRAELFGRYGTISSQERKEFVAFVAGSIENSKPQVFRTRAGDLMDRRRAVSRFLISPEVAQGLDLQNLARAAVRQLESDMNVSGLHWIAAVHRNTDHHHVHLVLAGMHVDASGGFRRVDISKARLVAMKQAIGLDIERQRGERLKSHEPADLSQLVPKTDADTASLEREVLPALRSGEPTRIVRPRSRGRQSLHPTFYTRSAIALRAVARRYQRQMEHELEQSYRQSQLERAA
jgi:hypothetical protein